MRPGDFRSDTVTRPTPAMRAAIASAEVGDDVFGDDPTVKALEARVAALCGQAAGLFVPSGTQANQLALLCHCRPGDDVLVSEGAHVQLSEGGGGAALAGVQFTAVGRCDRAAALLPEDVRGGCKGDDPSGHTPATRLLCIENTHNRGGGRILHPAAYDAVVAEARALSLAIHVDGARLFNAAVALGLPASTWGARADSVSVCLSKGLGAPVGSVLCGSRELVSRAHRFRKRLGGGMRQSGLLAAAGLHALDAHVSRLADDHARARRLAEGVAGLPGVLLDPQTVETNIVIFRLAPGAPTPAALCAAIAPAARALPFAGGVRFVTHLDVDDAHIDAAVDAVARALRGAPVPALDASEAP